VNVNRYLPLCLTFIFFSPPGLAFAETLVVNSYGGPYEAIIEERIIKPFEEKTGIDVVYDAVGSASQDYAKIKATGASLASTSWS
jgi:putative spermidine/putrescine transport system substrate-binding protein